MIKVNKIRISGNDNTSTEFIESFLKDAQKSRTYFELDDSLQNTIITLKGLDFFDSIDAHIVRSDGDTPFQWDIEMKVKEKKRKSVGFYGMAGFYKINFHIQLINSRSIWIFIIIKFYFSKYSL